MKRNIVITVCLLAAAAWISTEIWARGGRGGGGFSGGGGGRGGEAAVEVVAAAAAVAAAVVVAVVAAVVTAGADPLDVAAHATTANESAVDRHRVERKPTQSQYQSSEHGQLAHSGYATERRRESARWN